MLQLAERRDIQARLRDMHEACLELNDSWKEPNWRSMVVNREKRVFMCLVAKSACTTWLRVLLRLTGKQEAVAFAANTNRYKLHVNSGKYLLRFYKNSGSTRYHYLMGHYYKMMFVREPLERLISAYRDKMFRAHDYVPMRKAIKRMFRPNANSRFTMKLLYLITFLAHLAVAMPQNSWLR